MKYLLLTLFISQSLWAQPNLFNSSGPIVPSNSGSNFSGPNTVEFDTDIDVLELAKQIDMVLNFPDDSPDEIIRFQHLLHPDCCFINALPDLSKPVNEYNFTWVGLGDAGMIL